MSRRFLGNLLSWLDFRERMTFDRWADRYLELAAGKRTIKDDISLLKFLRAEFGPQLLDDITLPTDTVGEWQGRR